METQPTQPQDNNLPQGIDARVAKATSCNLKRLAPSTREQVHIPPLVVCVLDSAVLGNLKGQLKPNMQDATQ